jgi:hypothetical protein
MHSLRKITVIRVGLIYHPRLGNIIALISTNNTIPNNKLLGRTTPEVMAPSATTILDANGI